MKKIILLSLGLLLIVILVACSKELPSQITDPTNEEVYEQYCIQANGRWISHAFECEYVSLDFCERFSGTFNQCASACRNNPKSEICTMQCVPVCTFHKS